MDAKREVRPLLYAELAPWFHLLTAPEEYRKEAAFYSRVLVETARIPVNDVLELGSGGGNNASHMKARFRLTLTDVSEEMLAVSRELNPECEHVRGDMKTLRLVRRFDAVFVHDAVSYMRARDELAAAMKTAFVHCKAGGAALFCPDHIRDTFIETTESGGYDAGNRGLRYLDWTWDPEKKCEGYVSHFVMILRDGDSVDYRNDEHRLGLFFRQDWLDLMAETGYGECRAIPYPKDVEETGLTPVFAGVRMQ